MQNNLTQQYVLLTLGVKPSIKAFHNTERGVSLFTASIMELMRAGVITQDEKKKLVIQTELPERMGYLKPLYEHLEELKPQQAKSVANKYVATFLNKRMDELSDAVVDSLAENGSIQKVDTDGLFGPVERLAAQPAVLNDTVSGLRNAFMNGGTPDEDMMILAILLRHAKLLKRYFSEYELESIKKQLKAQKKNPANQMVKQIQDQIDVLLVAAVAGASMASQ